VKRSALPAVLGAALCMPLFLLVDTITLYPPRTLPSTINKYPSVPQGANFHPPYATPTPSSSLLTGLVSYWNLDELSGTRAKTDGSCTSCDLTAINAPSAAGGAGKYALSPVSNAASYVQDATIDLGTGDLTVVAWQRRIDAATGSAAIIEQKEQWAKKSLAVALDSHNRMTIGDGTNYAQASGSAYSLGRRLFVTAWYDSSDLKARLQEDLGTINVSSALAGARYRGTSWTRHALACQDRQPGRPDHAVRSRVRDGLRQRAGVYSHGWILLGSDRG
jgi:hypothetical protein